MKYILVFILYTSSFSDDNFFSNLWNVKKIYEENQQLKKIIEENKHKIEEVLSENRDKSKKIEEILSENNDLKEKLKILKNDISSSNDKSQERLKKIEAFFAK